MGPTLKSETSNDHEKVSMTPPSTASNNAGVIVARERQQWKMKRAAMQMKNITCVGTPFSAKEVSPIKLPTSFTPVLLQKCVRRPASPLALPSGTKMESTTTVETTEQKVTLRAKTSKSIVPVLLQ